MEIPIIQRGFYSVFVFLTKEMATPSTPGGFAGFSVPASNVLPREIIAIESAKTLAWCDLMLGPSTSEMPTILQFIPEGKCLL